MNPSQNLLTTLILLTTLALTGCGKDSSPTTSNEKKPTTIDVSTETPREERLVNTIDKYNVTCEHPSECPEYVAMLVLEEKVDFGFSQYRCSSFLIGEDILATNAHCIPDDLNTGDSCQDRIFALFPKSRTKKSQRVNCQKIISKFRDSVLGYDYAFIKLEKSPNRAVPEIEINEKTNSMELSVWKIDPKESYSGLIKKRTCNLVDDSLIGFYEFNTPFGPSFSYGGCETERGNSGSPVLNKEGKIIGIHMAGVKNWDQYAEILKDLIPDGFMETLDYATNFSCLCKNGDGYTHLCENTPKTCQKVTDDLVSYKNHSDFFMEQGKKFLSPEDLVLAEQIIQTYSSSSIEFSGGFIRKTVRDNEKPISFHLFARLTPKCIKDLKNLWEESSEYNLEGKEIRTLNFSGIPLCDIDLTLNSKLQVTGMKLDKSKCFREDFYLDFSGNQQELENLNNESIKVTWGPYSKDGYVLPSAIDLNLPKCETTQPPLASN